MTFIIRYFRRIKRYFFHLIYLLYPKERLTKQVDDLNIIWLFIIGCNNSGTTLLKTIIESHPNVIGIEGEGQYRTNEFTTDRDIGLNRLFSQRLDVFRDINEVDPLRVKYDWLVSLMRRKRRFHRYILEKTTVNAVRVPWLRKNFPQAKFIVLFREAYAVVEGMKRKENISIERGAKHWDKTNRLILDDFEGFENVLYLSYERLTDSPKQEIDRVWNFLGLNADKRIHQQNYTVHGNQSKIINQNDKSLKRLSNLELEVILELTKSTQLRITRRVSQN